MNLEPDRRLSRRTLAAAILLGLVLSAAVAVRVPVASAYTPRAGDTFSYSETITVSNGQGVYSGYKDETQVSGSERVDGVSGNLVSAFFTYSFNYNSNQGTSTSSSSSGDYTWSVDNYTYANGTDNQVGYAAPVHLWYAMNTSIPVGGEFTILNTQFTVLSKNSSFELPSEGRYVQAVQAEGKGQYQRDDSYGVFSASYTWFAYFDPTTGYIIGYNYLEQDTGQYNGQSGSFTYTDDLYVTSSSYPLATTSAPSTTINSFSTTISTSTGTELLAWAPFILIVIIVVALIAIAALRVSRRRRRLPEHSPTPSTIPPAPAVPPPPSQWQSNINLGSAPPREQVVIRDVAMVNCKYCGTLIPTTAQTCPYCGGPRQ